MSRSLTQPFAFTVTVVAAAVGATLVFGSRLFLETLDAPATPTTLLLLRMLGSTIGGMAFIYFAMRRSTDRRLWVALLLTGTVEDGGMSVFFAGGIFDGVVNSLAWGVEAALVAMTALHLAMLVVMLRTSRLRETVAV